MSEHETSGHPENHGSSHICRVCTSAIDENHPASRYGFCHHCVYKILIFVVVVMVIVSYVAWFSLF